jgi:pyruvate/2-oxoglutarate dehydrogenase complex dihydrolipoamide acyltransferase (E2) component
MRGMTVLRIDRNVDGLLRDPQMRQAAVNLMLGKSAEIYGPGERDVTPAKAQIVAPAASASEAPEADDFEDAPPPAAAEQPPFGAPAATTPPEDPRAPLRKQLAAMVDDRVARARLEAWKGKASGRSALELINGLLADDEAKLEELQTWLDRCAKLTGGQG